MQHFGIRLVLRVMASTTLHHAAKTGDLTEIGRFLSIEADVNEVDKLQRTPLHLAAWAGHVVRLPAHGLSSMH